MNAIVVVKLCESINSRVSRKRRNPYRGLRRGSSTIRQPRVSVPVQQMSAKTHFRYIAIGTALQKWSLTSKYFVAGEQISMVTDEEFRKNRTPLRLTETNTSP